MRFPGISEMPKGGWKWGTPAPPEVGAAQPRPGAGEWPARGGCSHTRSRAAASGAVGRGGPMTRLASVGSGQPMTHGCSAPLVIPE